MRAVEILLLILVALYVVGVALYIYSSSVSIISRASSGSVSTPNLANLPRNFTRETLYLDYRVDGYVNISGGIIDINNAIVRITASYSSEQQIVDQSSNSTGTVNTTTSIYYRISANGDRAIIWALAQLISVTYNVSPNISITSGWSAKNVSDIFGNLSLFSKIGEGHLQGGSGIAYIEYSLNTKNGTIVVRIAKDLGVPLECLINTEWGNLRFRLVNAS